MRPDSTTGRDAAIRSGDWIFWAIPVLAVIAALRTPFGFADLGWQVRLGDQMLREGTPWIREAFAATHIGDPMVPNAWLSQVLYAWTNAVAGFTGLRMLDILFWASGPVIASLPARLLPERRLAIVIAMAMGYLLLLPTSDIRPQNFASAGFALTLVMIQTVKSWRTALALGLPLFVLWQNLHPSVPIAALVLGLVSTVQWGLYLAGKANRPVALSALTAAAGAAIFATPAGVSVLAFARYNTIASKAFGATEWFPLWHPVNRPFLVVFLASVALVAAVCWIERKRLTPGIVIPAMVTMVMALITARFLFFYAIAIVPLLALLQIGKAPMHAASSRSILTGSAISALAAALASFVMPFLPQRDQGEELAKRLIACTDAGASGTVFNAPTLGGAIVFYGTSHWKVAFDGRFYRFSRSEIQLMQRTATEGDTLFQIERIYHPAAFALDLERSRALVTRIEAQPEAWERIFDNGQDVLFIRRQRSKQCSGSV